jgi:hypothetical protein
MKKILGYSLALSLLFSPVILNAAAENITAATPSDEATALVSKQLGKLVDNLKEALDGMRTAIGKRDLAQFRLYRMQARSAITDIEKLGGVTVEAVTNAKEKAEKAGEMKPTPTPSATPTPEATSTPSATPTP